MAVVVEGNCWIKVAQWESADCEARYSIRLKTEQMMYFLTSKGIIVASISGRAATKDFRWKRLFDLSELDSRTEAVVGPVDFDIASLFRPKSRIVGERFFFNRGTSKEAFVLKYPPDGAHHLLLAAVDFSAKIKQRISESALSFPG